MLEGEFKSQVADIYYSRKYSGFNWRQIAEKHVYPYLEQITPKYYNRKVYFSFNGRDLEGIIKVVSFKGLSRAPQFQFGIEFLYDDDTRGLVWRSPGYVRFADKVIEVIEKRKEKVLTLKL